MKTAIVGGGIGGITTALLLLNQGHSVTLLERKERLGGRLVYQQVGESRIDQGPTIVLLPELLLDILEDAGMDRSLIPLVRCDPMYRIHYADGTVLNKWSDTEKQCAEIDRKFPGEGAGFRRFMADMAQMYIAGKAAFLDKPFLKRREFWNYRNLSLLGRLQAYRTVRGIVSRYFKDERLRDAFSLQTLYIGGAPFQSPGLYSLLPYAEHAFGVWYMKGGYAGLSDLLAKRLVAAGADIRTGTEVRELLVEQGRCVGLRTDQGEERFDSVIYNGEFPGLPGLLPAKIRPKEKAYIPSSGCVLAYLSVNKRWPDASAHQFFLPDGLMKQLRTLFNARRLSDNPSYYVFNPVAIDDSAAASGMSVLYVLIPVPAGDCVDWEKQSAHLVDKVLVDAEKRGFAGLRQAIAHCEIRTPREAAMDGLYQGGSFGIAPILKQSAIFRPQIVPYPIEGLYAVGASVHPGGGIPIVMQGARLLAQQMKKEWESWSYPSVSNDARR